MFSDTCDVDQKLGIKRLYQFGGYMIIVNRALYEDDDQTANRYAVVNAEEGYVDSVHNFHQSALARTQKLIH